MQLHFGWLERIVQEAQQHHDIEYMRRLTFTPRLLLTVKGQCPPHSLLDIEWLTLTPLPLKLLPLYVRFLETNKLPTPEEVVSITSTLTEEDQVGVVVQVETCQHEVYL
jgi:hypothetical protein